MDKRIYIRDTDLKGKGRTQDFYNRFLQEIREKNLADKVQLIRVADLGVYGKGIAMRILPNNFLYTNLTESHISEIIEKSVSNDKLIEKISAEADSKQLRIVLRNCGVIDPESLEDYIAHGGYQALAKALLDLSPLEVIEEIKTSSLRGRGGAGFPTGLKWKLTHDVECDQKYVICNGDEGDPGAYMDRSVLEGDPHSVIEGMIIEGYAVKATKGFFYIRAEYPLAIERIQKAINEAATAGLLGKGILGSSFNFDIEVRLGAGAFVCGEETALIASIEGKRGYPHPRPPYPAVKGLWGKSTIINNVETLANIPVIIEKGGKWFSEVGIEGSTGTKVFAVTGKVKNSGLVEVPMGTAIKDVVFGLGGGAGGDKEVKAIQTGGPSGGVIPQDFFDTPLDYSSLQKLGSIMGSGGMIVMDKDDCVIDIVKFYLKFCVDESCGKCTPCRIGGLQMLKILDRIAEGNANEDDLELLRKISFTMQKASLCGLGQTAPNPVLSTLKYFEEEYINHVTHKRCPAGKCSGLFNFSIIEEKCVKCGMCFRACPVDAISGDRKTGYIIHQEKCIKCGKCFEVCKFDAVSRG